MQPGKYYFNPDAFHITEVDTRAQVWTYAGGYKRASISLTVDAKGDIVQTRTEVDVPTQKDNADRAVVVKMEGWDVPLELRVVAQVSPTEASCVVASVGTLKEIEDRVLTPSIRAITRDVAGGSYEVTEARVDETGKPVLNAEGKPIFVTVNRPTKVLDLINQRPLIEGEIERRIRPEGLKSCVTIREVRLGEPAIPPELLVAVRREQLATQLAKAFIQEKGAQEKRIESDKAKATADQQSDLVRAEIAVQTSVQNAQALRNQGQGERDRLTFISEGQRAQTEVLGADATVQAAAIRTDPRPGLRLRRQEPERAGGRARQCAQIRAGAGHQYRLRQRGRRQRFAAWRRNDTRRPAQSRNAERTSGGTGSTCAAPPRPAQPR